jgi:hypothetical protein
MAKRRHHLTVRVYDSASKRKEYEYSFDRYSLYFPYPKEWIKDGHVGDYLGFNFFDNGNFARRVCWGEWNLKYGYASNLGKRVKLEELPPNIQRWVKNFEEKWNNYINNPDDPDIKWEWEKL